MRNLSAAIYKSLLANSEQAIIIFEVNHDFNTIDCNDAYEKLGAQIGISSSLHSFDSFILDLDKEDQALLLNLISEASASKQKQFLTINLKSPAGNNQLEIELLPIVTDVEVAKQIICIIKIVSSTDHLENILSKLNDGEPRLNAFFEQAPLGICVLRGPELITEYANTNILKLWGRTLDEVVGLPQEIARPEVSPLKDVINQVKDIFLSGEPLYLDEIRSSTLVKSGYFNAIYQPLKNEKNEVDRLLVIIKDITEQVNARKELEKAKDILKIAMEASNMGSWNVDLKNKTIVLSERSKQIYELSEPKLSIEKAKSLVVSEHADALAKCIRSALHNRTSFSIDYQININGHGKTKWLRTAGKAYYNKEGKALYIAGAVLDITEHKQDEIRKNDFIGIVSHELKTPLTSLSAYIQLLQYKITDETESFTKEILDKVGVQVKRMSGMIDGFLNVSLLESGKIVLDKSTFDLVELIRNIAEESRIFLPSHFIQVIANEKINVNADREKMINVINNLINNAAKYSNKDSLIAIKCEKYGNHAHISIEDEGIGIQAADVEKIFDRFYRVDSTKTKTIPGFGVGLYICSEIVKRHEGKIWVISEPKIGSVFHFTLPINT